MLIHRGTTLTTITVTIIRRIVPIIAMPTIRPGGLTEAIVRGITTVAKTKETTVVTSMIVMPGVADVTAAIATMNTPMTGIRNTTTMNEMLEETAIRRFGVMYPRHRPDIPATVAW